MEHFVLGVDGGGTKTELALLEKNSGRVVRGKFGCTNHELLPGGFSELKTQLQQAVFFLLESAGATVSQIESAVLGLAGADTGAQRKSICQVAEAIGLGRFVVCNDAYLPIKAGCADGVGIAMINGTGCTAAGIDPSDRMLQIGGMGELTGDCGGGDYLARQACAASYAALYKKGPDTQMTALLMQEAGTASAELLFEILPERLQTGEIRLRDLNRVVFQAACRQDSEALKILNHMGAENARSIVALAKTLEFPKEISVVLAGSIFQKGEHPAAVNMLELAVRNGCPEHSFQFTLLKEPPVVGALLWAAETINHIDPKLRQKVIDAFV